MAAILALGAAAVGMSPAAAGRPVRIMPLGASITHGYGSSDGNGYRGVLRARLTHDAGMRVDFVGSQRSGTLADAEHEGHPGWRIDQIAARADEWVAAYRPRVVVVHLGTNDMIQNYRTATAPERLAALADRIVAAGPGVTVYVSSLVASAAPEIDARIEAFNARLPGLLQGRPGVVYVDQSRSVGPGELVDTVHPGDTAYARMAETWYTAIAG